MSQFPDPVQKWPLLEEELGHDSDFHAGRRRKRHLLALPTSDLVERHPGVTLRMTGNRAPPQAMPTEQPGAQNLADAHERSDGFRMVTGDQQDFADPRVAD